MCYFSMVFILPGALEVLQAYTKQIPLEVFQTYTCTIPETYSVKMSITMNCSINYFYLRLWLVNKQYFEAVEASLEIIFILCAS